MSNNTLIKFKAPPTPDTDVLELNPWLTNYPNYKELYAKFGRELGNKYVTAIFLLCDPDEELNLFFRMSERERKEAISANYIEVDWDEDTIAACVDSYPFDVLDSVKRSLKEEKDKLTERAKFIRSHQYKLDIPTDPGENFDKDVFNAQVKTIELVEKMQGNTIKIYDAYDKVLQKFNVIKSSSQSRGGYKETNVDKGQI